MKTIMVCKYCGSARVFQDAVYNINEDSYDTYDDQSCEYCGADSDTLTIEWEVPDDFNIREDCVELDT